MNTYYGYLDADERERFIEETKLDNELSRLETMYEMVNLKLKQMENDVHLKVLTEAGTYDDYAYLMTEAEAAVAEEKKGILASIIEGIKKFFKSIGNAFKGLCSGGDPNEDIKLSTEDFNEVNNKVGMIGKITAGLGKVTSGIASANVSMIKEGCKDVLSSPFSWVVAGSAATVGGYKVIKRQVLQGHCQKFVGLVDKVDELIAKVENSVAAQWFSSAADKVKESLNKIKEDLNSIRKKFMEFLSGKKSDDGNTNNNGNPDSGASTDGQSGPKTIKGKDGYIYTIDKNGNTSVKDANGNAVNVNANNYPPEVKSAIKGIKAGNAKATSMDRANKGIVGSSVKYEYRYNAEKNIVEVFDKSNPSTSVGTIKISDDGKSFANLNRNSKSGKYRFKGDDIDDKVVRAILSKSSANKASNTPTQNSNRRTAEDRAQQVSINNANKRATEAEPQNKQIIAARFGGQNQAVTSNVSSKGKSASVTMQSTGYITITTSDGLKIYVNKGDSVEDKCKDKKIDKGLLRQIKSAVNSLNKQKSSCDKEVSKLKEKFDKDGLAYTESTDDFDITESFEEICTELEDAGYTVIESGDDLIITPSITTDESIFGEFVESAIDEIIFEDRFEQELYDLAEVFETL